MQLFRQRRGCLLCTLQVGREDLLNLRVGKRVREAFRAPPARLTQRSVRFIGNLIRVAYKKNGAHALGMRTESNRQCRNEIKDSNSCECSHEESASMAPYSTDNAQGVPTIGPAGIRQR